MTEPARQLGRYQLLIDYERAVTPAVGKSLEIGIVVLFIGLVTSILLGGIVPTYRAATGAAVGDRVLTTASHEVEASVPTTGREVDARHRVRLPAQISGRGYRLVVDGRHLVLEHPDPSIGGRTRLVLPAIVDRIRGRWDSGGSPVVRITGDRDGLIVTLTDGGAP